MLAPADVGFDGVVQITSDKTLRLKRGPKIPDEIQTFNNNQFLWEQDTESLYYQNRSGKLFKVYFERVTNLGVSENAS